MQKTLQLETLLKRDRAIVALGLIGVAGIAWAYMLYLAWRMDTSAPSIVSGMAMSLVMPWSTVDFALMYVMWSVMMIAMMVPTAAPMILMFVTVNRRRKETQRPYVSTGVFLMGYLVIWFGFAVLATTAQWGLHQASIISSMMGSLTPILGGVVLIVAAVFQWTPLKYVCLNHCRTPMGFIMSEWREGAWGALRMGFKHGGFCLGCCWFLMALMFVAGVMNIVWMAGIAAYMLLEKVVHVGVWGNRVTWAAGLGIGGWGSWMIVRAVANF